MTDVYARDICLCYPYICTFSDYNCVNSVIKIENILSNDIMSECLLLLGLYVYVTQ